MNAIATKAMRCSFERSKMVFNRLAAQPGKGPFHHPADAGGNELSVPTARNGLDGDAERLSVSCHFRLPAPPMVPILFRRPLV